MSDSQTSKRLASRSNRYFAIGVLGPPEGLPRRELNDFPVEKKGLRTLLAHILLDCKNLLMFGYELKLRRDRRELLNPISSKIHPRESIQGRNYGADTIITMAQEEIGWIDGEDEPSDTRFTFDYVCDSLGTDSETVRGELRSCLKEVRRYYFEHLRVHDCEPKKKWWFDAVPVRRSGSVKKISEMPVRDYAAERARQKELMSERENCI